MPKKSASRPSLLTYWMLTLPSTSSCTKQIIPQRDMLCPTNVGTVVCDVQRRRVIDMQRHAAEAYTEAQLRHRVGAEYRLILLLPEAPPRALPPSWTVRSVPVVLLWRWSERRSVSRCMMASTCHGLLEEHSPILPLPNSSAACCSWCRRLQQEPPRQQADTQYLACPCWCSDLVVTACATYSAGNAPPESCGCCC